MKIIAVGTYILLQVFRRVRISRKILLIYFEQNQKLSEI